MKYTDSKTQGCRMMSMSLFTLAGWLSLFSSDRRSALTSSAFCVEKDIGPGKSSDYSHTTHSLLSTETSPFFPSNRRRCVVSTALYACSKVMMKPLFTFRCLRPPRRDELSLPFANGSSANQNAQSGGVCFVWRARQVHKIVN